jgi:hypothetical protein
LSASKAVDALCNLSVNLTAIADSNDKYPKHLVLNLNDHSVVSDAVFPQFAEFGAFQRFAYASWVLEIGHTTVQEIDDAARNLLIEPFEFTP